MILGLGTRVVAVIMGLMLWSFAVANPVAGEIRLSRDIALMGLCVAVALSGAGVWSLEERVWQHPSTFAQRRDSVLLLIRLSLAYTLLASAVFVREPFANPLNTTLPVVLVGLMGMLLAVGVGPQWLMALLFVWMLYVLPAQMLAKGIFVGLDAAKRELGFLVAALVYLLLGPDRWIWPKITSARAPAASPAHATSAD